MKGQLILFPEDSLASQQALTEKGMALQTIDGSGQICAELLTPCGPAGCLLRTLLTWSGWKSLTSLPMIWRPVHTKRSYLLFRLSLSGPSISGKGSGLLPTIRASEWKGTGPKGSKSHTHWLNHYYLSATVTDSGKLNPTFAERMMGYPSDWLKID